ncbi:neuronal acetylcholine receptor subunit non-alpha-2-like isoform X2 [Ptychodera flava]
MATKSRLFNELLIAHNREISPQNSFDEPVKVKMSLVLSRIIELDRTNMLTIETYKRYTWEDYRFAWNPEDFGGLTTIHLPVVDIWTPERDLRLYYGSEYSIDQSASSGYASVRNNGLISMLTRPASRTTAQCVSDDADRTVRNCSFVYGLWSYGSNEVEFSAAEKPVDTRLFAGNINFELLSSTAERKQVTHPDDPSIINDELAFTVNLKSNDIASYKYEYATGSANSHFLHERLTHPCTTVVLILMGLIANILIS